MFERKQSVHEFETKPPVLSEAGFREAILTAGQEVFAMDAIDGEFTVG